MIEAILSALTKEEVAVVFGAISSLVGDERDARASGKLIDLGKPYRPTVWHGRPAAAPDRRLVDPLSALSPHARNELQALFLLARDAGTTFEERLRHVKSLGGGESQVQYLYGKLLGTPDYLSEGLRKVGLAAWIPPTWR